MKEILETIFSALVIALFIIVFFTDIPEAIASKISGNIDRTEEDEEEMIESAERAQVFATMIEQLTKSYPDAKKFKVTASYEFQESNDYNVDNELCPVVEIDIER